MDSCQSFVQTIFHKGPGAYTLLLVSSGAGSICGALAVAAKEKMKGQGRVTLLILISLGIITAGFALCRWLPLSCVLIFLGGRSDYGVRFFDAVIGANSSRRMRCEAGS